MGTHVLDERLQQIARRAHELLERCRRGEAQIAETEASRDLGDSLEFLLTEHLRGDGGWCDGIWVEHVAEVGLGQLEVGGRAWICDLPEHGCERDGLTKVRALLSVGDPGLMLPLFAYRMDLGDADLEGSARPAGVPYTTRAPTRWSKSYAASFAPRRVEDELAERVAELSSWVEAHPGRPIVDESFTPLTVEQAEALIRASVEVRRLLRLESSWLDGGDALWIRSLR